MKSRKFFRLRSDVQRIGFQAYGVVRNIQMRKSFCTAILLTALATHAWAEGFLLDDSRIEPGLRVGLDALHELRDATLGPAWGAAKVKPLSYLDLSFDMVTDSFDVRHDLNSANRVFDFAEPSTTRHFQKSADVHRKVAAIFDLLEILPACDVVVSSHGVAFGTVSSYPRLTTNREGPVQWYSKFESSFPIEWDQQFAIQNDR